MARGVVLGEQAPRPVVLYLPSRFKRRQHITVVGEAETGEISPKGTVELAEDWDGRVAPTARPATIHWTYDLTQRRFRLKTHQELVDQGLFIPGQGPAGVQRTRQRIEETP